MGGRWRVLPDGFGVYGSVKRRHYCWIEIWACLMSDSIIVRAALVCARDAQAKWGVCLRPGSISRRVEHQNHAATRVFGLPLRLIAMPGHRNAIVFAHDLINGLQAGTALADKGMTQTILPTGCRKPAHRWSSRRSETSSASTRPNSIKSEISLNAS